MGLNATCWIRRQVPHVPPCSAQRLQYLQALHGFAPVQVAAWTMVARRCRSA